MFGMIRDLIRKIFVRGELEQFGWSRVAVCHGTNLASVRIEAIRPFGYSAIRSGGWRSAPNSSRLANRNAARVGNAVGVLELRRLQSEEPGTGIPGPRTRRELADRALQHRRWSHWTPSFQLCDRVSLLRLPDCAHPRPASVPPPVGSTRLGELRRHAMRNGRSFLTGRLHPQIGGSPDSQGDWLCHPDGTSCSYYGFGTGYGG